MANRIELLAILLSGFFPASRREKSQLRSDLPNDDVMRMATREIPEPSQRPTLRLLRLIGRHRDRTSIV